VMHLTVGTVQGSCRHCSSRRRISDWCDSIGNIMCMGALYRQVVLTPGAHTV
jgi:hypothetical protein